MDVAFGKSTKRAIPTLILIIELVSIETEDQSVSLTSSVFCIILVRTRNVKSSVDMDVFIVKKSIGRKLEGL